MASTRVGGRIRRQLRRVFLDPPLPLLGIEVRARSIGVVRMTQSRGQRRFAAAASLPLPDGCLALAMNAPNVIDARAFVDTLGAVMEKVGAMGGGRTILSLPDAVARVLLLPQQELEAVRRKEREQFLRFKLRGRTPFEARDAHLVWSKGDPQKKNVILAAIANIVRDDYESALKMLRLTPGMIELSGLALLRTIESRRPAMDRLLLNCDEGTLSLYVCQQGWPIIARTVIDQITPARVAREVQQTWIYYQERLQGTGIREIVWRPAPGLGEDAQRAIEDATGLAPERLSLLGLEGAPEALAMSQEVSGAAAGLMWEAA
ncbi:MAG: hypothetical protein MUF51_08095 [Vicinamibacteria bacterium]|jgi:hypothetical protein|nr:hypothetical protein [Vicinamibacteria bacterium]